MSSDEAEPQLQKLKSINSQIRVFVKFLNKTDRCVALEWLDFQGDHKSYIERMEPGDSMQMKTFQGHPWVFLESDCRHPLVVLPDCRQIYFPAPQNFPPYYRVVNIVNPLLSLRQSCLNSVHRHFSINLGYKDKEQFARKVDTLFLPRTISEDLKRLSKDQNNNNIPVFIVPEEE